MACVVCGNEELTKAGRDSEGQQRYRCARCGHRQTRRSVSAFCGYRFPDDVIALAVRGHHSKGGRFRWRGGQASAGRGLVSLPCPERRRNPCRCHADAVSVLSHQNCVILLANPVPVRRRGRGPAPHALVARHYRYLGPAATVARSRSRPGAHPSAIASCVPSVCGVMHPFVRPRHARRRIAARPPVLEGCE